MYSFTIGEGDLFGISCDGCSEFDCCHNCNYLNVSAAKVQIIICNFALFSVKSDKKPTLPPKAAASLRTNSDRDTGKLGGTPGKSGTDSREKWYG
jgi:hypothetical protein